MKDSQEGQLERAVKYQLCWQRLRIGSWSRSTYTVCLCIHVCTHNTFYYNSFTVQGYFTQSQSQMQMQCLHTRLMKVTSPLIMVSSQNINLQLCRQDSERTTIPNRHAVTFMHLPYGRQCLKTTLSELEGT